MLSSFTVGFIVLLGTGNTCFFCFPAGISPWKEGPLSTEALCDQTPRFFLLSLPGETLSSQMERLGQLGQGWLCSTASDAKCENCFVNYNNLSARRTERSSCVPITGTWSPQPLLPVYLMFLLLENGIFNLSMAPKVTTVASFPRSKETISFSTCSTQLYTRLRVGVGAKDRPDECSM